MVPQKKKNASKNNQRAQLSRKAVVQKVEILRPMFKPKTKKPSRNTDEPICPTFNQEDDKVKEIAALIKKVYDRM